MEIARTLSTDVTYMIILEDIVMILYILVVGFWLF